MGHNNNPDSVEYIKEQRLSVVIPSFNEANNIPKLCSELVKVLSHLNISYEIIIVDDGSTDNTWERITAFHEKEDLVKGIRLSRNFGHQYALVAGMRHASGDAVISMDSDLQHPPKLIPQLVDEWRKGNRIVKTIRSDLHSSSIFKNISSKMFYRFFSFLSGVEIENGMADFRLIDRKVVHEILRFEEEGLFLRGIVQWVGFPSSTITYECGERYSGKTKYTLVKMIRFAWHGLTSFSTIPLRIGVVIGLIASLFSFIGIFYAIVSKVITGGAVSGWASTVAIISFLFSMLFLFLGILGEYVGRILVEVRKRPKYLVNELLGIDNTTAPDSIIKNNNNRNYFKGKGLG